MVGLVVVLLLEATTGPAAPRLPSPPSSTSCRRRLLALVVFVAGFAISPMIVGGNALVQDLVARHGSPRA